MAAAEKPPRRPASHAGSWYSDGRAELTEQLAGWLEQADGARAASTTGTAAAAAAAAAADSSAAASASSTSAGGELSSATTTRAIISPHAGYAHSGPSAAFGFRELAAPAVRDTVARVFVLGPSHCKYLTRCALTECGEYETPVGSLRVDRAVLDRLATSPGADACFETLTVAEDADEHSVEMQLPYIRHALEERDVPVVPIVVGSLSATTRASVSALLAPFLEDPENFFVVSSDFCHWGTRFSYTRYDKTAGEIYQSIEALDRRGMAAIETGELAKFSAYLAETKNTICGRHPIQLFMATAEAVAAAAPLGVQFVHYAQSSRCRRTRDSSVSYAVAVVKRRDGRPRPNGDDHDEHDDTETP